MDDPVLLGIAAIVVIAVAAAVAPRIRLAAPLILLAVGIGVGFLPFVPAVVVDPEIILVGVLPPLLYAAAVRLPAVEFRRDFGPIAGLSIVLVVLSSLVLAGFFVLVVPGMSFAIAFAFGAILSPTDAVATSIVKRLGISPRIVTILDGESLLNDATALVLLRVTLAATAVGSASFGAFAGAFLWGVLVAIVVGALVGIVNLRVRAWIGNPAANTALSFVVPFVAYLPAERLDGSGLVAAVVAGIVTSQGATRWFTPEQRISDELNWRTIELVLEGGVFLLMGLEVRDLLDANVKSDHGIGQGVVLALAALGLILVVRTAYTSLVVWTQSRSARGRRSREALEAMSERLDSAPTEALRLAERGNAARLNDPERRERRLQSFRKRVSRALNDLDYYQSSPLGWRHGAIIVWAGMRGVVTLAAAQTLPRDTPDRPLFIFVALLVAVIGLLLQGTTLPWLVRMLGLQGGESDSVSHEEQSELGDELRQAAAEALTAKSVRRRDGSTFPDDYLDQLGSRFIRPPADDTGAAAREAFELRLALVRVMRSRLNDISSDGRFSTPALRHALEELDADELSIRLRLEGE